MSNSHQDFTSTRNNLNQTYQRLSTAKKKIVQLFSVIYGPINRSKFLACVDSCHILDENEKVFTATTLSKYINTLINSEVLIQKRGKGPQCNPVIAEIATRDAVQEKSFELFAKITNQKISNSST